jgi:hypothetical protein
VGKGKYLLQMVLGKLDIHKQKDENGWAMYNHAQKLNCTCVLNLNLQTKTAKSPKKKKQGRKFFMSVLTMISHI